MAFSLYSCISLLIALLVRDAKAQSPVSRAEAAFSVLQNWYNEGTGLWDSTGWWNSANVLTTVADLAAVDGSVVDTAEDVFAKTYVMAPAVNPARSMIKTEVDGMPHTEYFDSWPNTPTRRNRGRARAVDASGWLNDYYDDDGWWALGWIAAYDVTKNQDYLLTAEGIFEGMLKGWPTNCNNGGIWWSVHRTYANAIANELFLSVAAHLANRASNKNYYLDWAKKEWAWFKASGMINSDFNINDGLSSSCQNNGGIVWTYNQGVILGGLVELNRASPDSSYLTMAESIAKAAIANLTDSNSVLHDVCEPNCGADGTQFKGVFARNLQLLHKVAPRAEYVNVIRSSANSIWANNRNRANQLSVTWSGPFISPANASTQSSALDALVAAVAVQ